MIKIDEWELCVSGDTGFKSYANELDELLTVYNRVKSLNGAAIDVLSSFEFTDNQIAGIKKVIRYVLNGEELT